MYPIERFTEKTRSVLRLAREAAEDAGHNYIGTEHLLLGLLREEGGLAFRALSGLGVRLEPVRETILAIIHRNEPVRIGPISPTSRTNSVIEMAFAEAQRRACDHVATEHLLLGLLVDGEGIGAQVLVRAGITLEKVRDEIDRLQPEGLIDEGTPTAAAQPSQRVVLLGARLHATAPATPALDALDAAVTEAQERGADGVTTADLLLGLLRLHDDPARTLLADHGVDREVVLRLIADISAPAAREAEN